MVHNLGEESEIVSFGDVITTIVHLILYAKKSNEQGKVNAFARAIEKWNGEAVIHGNSISIESSTEAGKLYVVDENECDCKFKGNKTICWHRAIYIAIETTINNKRLNGFTN